MVKRLRLKTVFFDFVTCDDVKHALQALISGRIARGKSLF